VSVLPLSAAAKMLIAQKLAIAEYFDSGLRYGHWDDFTALQARLFMQSHLFSR